MLYRRELSLFNILYSKSNEELIYFENGERLPGVLGNKGIGSFNSWEQGKFLDYFKGYLYYKWELFVKTMEKMRNF